MKKFIALAVTVIMSIGSVTTVSAATFYDINDVPWEGAKEYINSVSNLGLMVGDTDNSGHKVFRANDRITYCEVMQLAYSVLKNADAMGNGSDTVSKWRSVMQAAYIPEWAYNCVSYGLENGILSENDVTIFMKDEGVSRDATRENVAVIFGKAIEHLAAINSTAVLSFNDKDKVALTSVPYIDLLSRFSIIVGDDSDNFNPKYYINRAEMAVITSKTYYKVKELKGDKNTQTEVDVIAGTVTLTDDGNSSKTIAVSENETGTVLSYTINSDTPVLSSEGTIKSYKDVSIGDIITVSSMNGVVASVVVNVDNASLETEKRKSLTGYMNSITSTAITFDTEDGEQEQYELASNIKFYLNGGEISRDDLYEYADGKSVIKVEITLNSNDYVEKIDAKKLVVKGTLSTVDTSEIVVIDEDETRMTLTVDRDIECTFNGESVTYSKMKNLVLEEENTMLVEAEMDEKDYTVVNMTVVSSQNNEGQVISFSKSEITFVNAIGVEYAYKVEPAAIGFINDKYISSFSSVIDAASSDNATIKVTFSSREYVNRVYVTTKAD